MAKTARTVTSAALVMVAIFATFVTLPLIELKMLGITLAAGVLIDATIVRGIALPAVVTLLGERGMRAPRRATRAPACRWPRMSAEALTPMPGEPMDDRSAALAIHVTITALIGFVVTMIWGLTDSGEFWPMWVWFGLCIPLAVHGGLWSVWRSTPAGRTGPSRSTR